MIRLSCSEYIFIERGFTMPEQRIRRTSEERVAEIDEKIQAARNNIAKLEAKKSAILNPRPRLTKAGKIKLIMEQAKASGMSAEEIAAKLGISL